MNKTVSINLGGMFFHIDETAYQKLNRYFDAIRRSLSPDGKDEIMSDIEARIAELLSEKVKNEKQVVGMREIDEVIAVMGKPEDYRIDEEGPQAGEPGKNFFSGETFDYYRSKKFYRDEDNAIVGGVCAGLGHYFRVDPLWIRIIFILFLIGFVATPGIVYLLLWVLIPNAVTTTEKLEMRGEPINISNIEKKVREEFANVNERYGNQFKTGANRAGSAARGIVSTIGRIIAAIVVFFTGIWLGGLLVALVVTLFATAATAPIWYRYIEMYNITGAPITIIALSAFFVIAIPVLGVFMLGLRILIKHVKPVNNYVTFSLVALWFLSLISFVYFITQQSMQFTNEGKSVTRTELALSKKDTLQIRFRYNNYFAKDVYGHTDLEMEQDSVGNEILYSNDVRLYIMKADGNKPYVQIERTADAATKTEGREVAEKIKYNFTFKGNTLILDNYHISPLEAKYHDQTVSVYLYLPDGYKFKPDASVREFDHTDNSFFNLWFDSDQHIYEMGRDKVYCHDCIGEDGEMHDGVEAHALTDEEIREIEAETRASMKQTAEEMKLQAKQMEQDAKQMAEDARQMVKDAAEQH